MSTAVYKLASWEQGSITSSGDIDSSTRIRTPGYTAVTPGTEAVYKVTASDVNGNSLRINVMMYDSDFNCIYDTGWDPSGTALSDSHNASYIRIVLSYSSGNISPSDLAECTLEYSDGRTWYIDSAGELLSTEFIEWPENYMLKPYPAALWRIKETEEDGNIYYAGGVPYNMLFLDIEGYSFHTVIQGEYITIYDLHTAQDDFENHGYCILQPTKCTITEELNGEYSIEIEHPTDELGRWKYIREFNLVKAMGQLFRITKTNVTFSGSTGKVTATGIHIFYQWNDYWIVPGRYLHISSSLTMTRLISELRQNSMTIAMKVEEETTYHIQNSTDIQEIDSNVARAKWGTGESFNNGSAPTDVLMGDGGIIETFGGELYRDNFYWSLNTRKEGSSDNAFDIRVGKNLTGIKRTIDVSTMCTYYRLSDNFGQFWAVAYTPGIVAFIPHNITRFFQKRYSEPNMAQLISDGFAEWVQKGAPIVCYEVDFKHIEQNQDFKEFSNKPKYEVGNVGDIYDERLGGVITLKITKTVTDAITGEVTSVIFGSKRQFLSKNYNAIVNIEGAEIHTEAFFQFRDKNGKWLYDSKNRGLTRKVSET